MPYFLSPKHSNLSHHQWVLLLFSLFEILIFPFLFSNILFFLLVDLHFKILISLCPVLRAHFKFFIPYFFKFLIILVLLDLSLELLDCYLCLFYFPLFLHVHNVNPTIFIIFVPKLLYFLFSYCISLSHSLGL